MYLLKLDENNKVLEIIKNPTEEQKQEGIVLEDLKQVGSFTKYENELYYIKKGE